MQHKKIKYNIEKEAAKISSLSSYKIDIFEYLTGLEILTSDQRRSTEQAKFLYSPLEKPFEKQKNGFPRGKANKRN